MYIQLKSKREIFTRRRRDSLKWAKTVKYRKKTSEIFRTLTKTSNQPHRFLISNLSNSILVPDWTKTWHHLWTVSFVLF